MSGIATSGGHGLHVVWLSAVCVCTPLASARTIEAIPAPKFAPPGWRFTAVGLSGDGSTAVGTLGTYLPLRWSREHGFEILPGPEPHITHGSATLASYDGAVVVGATFDWGPFQTFEMRWTGRPARGQWLTSHESPTGLSADGRVVITHIGPGYGGVPPAKTTRFVDDRVTDQIEGVRGLTLSADGLTIAGVRDGPGPASPFTWTRAGGVRDLGRLAPSKPAYARAISAVSNQTFGIALDAHDAFHLVRWSTSGVPESLGQIPAFALPTLGASNTMNVYPTADASVVVFSYVSTFGEEVRNYIWSSSLGMLPAEEHLARRGVDLTGWRLQSLRGISWDGLTIAGNGWFEGQPRTGFIITVPSPAGLLVLGMAGVVAARRGRAKA